MPDNESSAKIDTAAITEAIRQFRQRIKDLDAEVERINTAREERGEAKIDTAAITAIRQWIKDLDAAVQRAKAAGEALPPPIDRER